MGILKDAIDNWPEDEAYSLLCDWNEEGATDSERQKDTAFLITVFERETDSEELKARFLKRLNRGL